MLFKEHSMIKIIVLVLGLGIGFGTGVWWGQKHPEEAAKLSAEEERRFLEAQIAVNQKIRAKLDQLQTKSSSPAPGSGFVGAGQSGSAAAADVNDLKAETAKQEAELKQHLEKVK
jgi:hypothetical protein